MKIRKSSTLVSLEEMLDELEVNYCVDKTGSLDLGIGRIGTPSEFTDQRPLVLEHYRVANVGGQRALPLVPSSREWSGTWSVERNADGDRFVYAAEMNSDPDYDELCDALNDLIAAHEAINDLEIIEGAQKENV